VELADELAVLLEEEWARDLATLEAWRERKS